MTNVMQVVVCAFVGLGWISAQAQTPTETPTRMPGGVIVRPLPPVVAPMAGGKHEAPFVVRVDGPEDPVPEATLHVRVTIERRLLDATPLHVEVRLPEGVGLVRGELEETIVDAQATVVRREVELRLGERIPEEDVVVTVSQRGEGWGGHAEHRYRFGRPDPDAVQQPLRRSDPVDLGNGIIVRPVVVD